MTSEERDQIRAAIGKKTRHYWPCLVAALDSIDEAALLLRKIEWVATARFGYDGHAKCCPCCSGVRPEDHDSWAVVTDFTTSGFRRGHAEGCELARLLE